MYILVSESFHIRLTGRSLLHPVKVKWRFRYKPEWFLERWNSLCKPHYHPPPSISYHLPSYGAGLKLTTQGKPLSEILPLEGCLLQMRSLKYRTSAESFPRESVLIYRCKGGGGWGGGGGFWVESHGFQRGWRGDLSVLTAGGEGSSTIYSDTTKFLQPAPPPFHLFKKAFVFMRLAKAALTSSLVSQSRYARNPLGLGSYLKLSEPSISSTSSWESLE